MDRLSTASYRVWQTPAESLGGQVGNFSSRASNFPAAELLNKFLQLQVSQVAKTQVEVPN